MKIPTWLMFLSLGIASFAPVVSLRPGWWVPYYYGALLVWWVLVSVAAMRGVAREDQKAKRQLARTPHQLRDAKNAEAAETHADAVRDALAEVRLIIVARDGVDLYDRIRRDQLGDEGVRDDLIRRRSLHVSPPVVPGRSEPYGEACSGPVLSRRCAKLCGNAESHFKPERIHRRTLPGVEGEATCRELTVH